MKGLLVNVQDLQQKYVELQEFKKNSCIPIEKLVPELKNIDTEEEDELTELKLE